MVSGRHSEHLPEVDYLGKLQSKLTGHEKVVSFSIDGCNKIGAASADLRTEGGTITIEHSARRLTIQTADLDVVVDRVKTIWRHELRGPTLKTKNSPSASP